MQRRRFLQQTGTVALGAVALTGSANAREEGELPNENVDSVQVSIFGSRDNPNQVSTGTWIEHGWGWVDVEGESTRADVQRYLDRVDIEVAIDGDRLENPMQYWGDIHRNDEGNYRAIWRYATPPKPPGLHEFQVTVMFPEGFEDGLEEDGENQADFPPGHEYTYNSYYEVVPGGGNGNGNGRGGRGP